MEDRVGHIMDEVSRAISRRLRINNSVATEMPEAAFGMEEWNEFGKAKQVYKNALKTLRKAVASKSHKQVKEARKRLLTGYAGRFLAVVRESEKDSDPIPFATLEARAKKLDLSKTYYETLCIRPEPSKPGSWRPVGLSGHFRKAQQLILRDILLIEIGDADHDSTVRGAGGERGLFKSMEHAIDDGYLHWVSIDIRNFFPSLRPGHLAGFPFPKWVIQNIVFVPPDTHIRFIDKRYGVDLDAHTILHGDDACLPDVYPYSLGDIGSKLEMVRQGIIQGDVCAPQIARTVLGRELQRSLGKWDVAYASHLDDVLIGARTQPELKTSLQALTYHLKNLPAGPLELHDHAIRHIKHGVEFIGYRVSTDKYGDVHVRPAKKRFDRYRERLRDRLEASGAFTKPGLEAVAKEYEDSWYCSQAAWTKAKGPNGSDFSRPYLATETAIVLNRFIFDEFMAGIGHWHEDDIDFELIGEGDA